MSFFSLLLIAFSLAMDAFAVSVSAGFFFRRVFFRQAFLLAVTFGIFQAVMPLLGWIGGSLVYYLIARYSSWIAFLLLSFIGVNMIHEALSDREEGKKEYLSLRSLILLGVATSIDALIVGISFALFPIDIYFAVSVIGFVTFVLCFFGVYIGGRFGAVFGKKAEILGGIILIAMGMKIIIEYLYF